MGWLIAITAIGFNLWAIRQSILLQQEYERRRIEIHRQILLSRYDSHDL